VLDGLEAHANGQVGLSDPGRDSHRLRSFRQECLNLDWNEQVLAKKIANLASVIGRFEGGGPDILVLEEVENQQILNRLRLALPGAAAYVTAINLDGPQCRHHEQVTCGAGHPGCRHAD
jgi:hypothetical protein